MSQGMGAGRFDDASPLHGLFNHSMQRFLVDMMASFDFGAGISRYIPGWENELPVKFFCSIWIFP